MSIERFKPLTSSVEQDGAMDWILFECHSTQLWGPIQLANRKTRNDRAVRQKWLLEAQGNHNRDHLHAI